MSSMVMSSLGFLFASNCFGYLEIAMCMHAQSCVTVCDHTDCSQPGFSTHGISKARLLEWVSISSSRGSSQSRDRICISWISCIAKWILYHCSTWEAWEMLVRTAKQRKACSSLLQAQLCSMCNCHSTRLLMTLQCEWLVHRKSPKIYGGQHIQWPGDSFSTPRMVV